MQITRCHQSLLLHYILWGHHGTGTQILWGHHPFFFGLQAQPVALHDKPQVCVVHVIGKKVDVISHSGYILQICPTPTASWPPALYTLHVGLFQRPLHTWASIAVCTEPVAVGCNMSPNVCRFASDCRPPDQSIVCCIVVSWVVLPCATWMYIRSP